LLRPEAEHRVRDAPLRLHARRRDAVPARRQHRGRLGRRAAAPRRLEGPPAARLPELRGGELGPEGGRRPARAGRTGVAEAVSPTLRVLEDAQAVARAAAEEIAKRAGE